MNRLLLLLPVAAIAGAQPSQTALQVPLLGYLGSASPVGIRPIVGAPGAVVLGGSLTLPAGTTRIVPAPGGQFAIVERAGASESGVVNLTVSGAGDVTAIAQTFSHSDRIAFSPSGSVAVLYSALTNQAEVVTGLPASAQLTRTVDLSPASLPVTSIAVSDDSQAILAGVSDGLQGSIWSFIGGQPAQWVANAGCPSALRFFSGNRDAVAADRGWRQVVLLPAGGVPRVLAGAGQGVGAPKDLEISSDQQTVWVLGSNVIEATPERPGTIQSAPLSPATPRLLHIDLSSGVIGSVDSSIAAATITRLAGDSVFLLTSQAGDSSGIWWPSGGSHSVWGLTGPGGE